VREPVSLQDAMVGVDFVFNAAALKQVPSCEFYPKEALLTNALGTENVMNAALAGGVGRLTVLSTDKAAYPINADHHHYGAGRARVGVRVLLPVDSG
jgi:UDP-N-acetylglucosamine 4,6-dehydratase/5-epimerase